MSQVKTYASLSTGALLRIEREFGKQPKDLAESLILDGARLAMREREFERAQDRIEALEQELEHEQAESAEMRETIVALNARIEILEADLREARKPQAVIVQDRLGEISTRLQAITK